MDTLSLYRNLSQRNPGSVVFTSSYLTPLPLDRTSVIAELGCGLGGRATWVTRSRCCETHLYDQDTSLLDAAFMRAEEGGAEQLIHLHHVGEEGYGQVKAEPNSFDLLMTEGLAFNLDPFEHLQTWRALVKVGGTVVIVVPGISHSEVSSEVAGPLTQRSGMTLGTLDQYHEKISALSGYKLFHQVTLAQYSWDEHYQDLGRCLKGLIKSGDLSTEDETVINTQRELTWYRQVARGQLFLQAFVLTVTELTEGSS